MANWIQVRPIETRVFQMHAMQDPLYWRRPATIQIQRAQACHGEIDRYAAIHGACFHRQSSSTLA
jgi:hypothetical protein